MGGRVIVQRLHLADLGRAGGWFVPRRGAGRGRRARSRWWARRGLPKCWARLRRHKAGGRGGRCAQVRIGMGRSAGCPRQ
eukprot:10213949-Alexandrium_andersonii.AAC.1